MTVRWLMLTALLTTAAAHPMRAQETGLNLYGRPGAIDTPTAQVMPDGQLSGTFATFEGQGRNTLSFQISPRLTGSFRYSRIDDFNAPGDNLFERGFDLSYLILTETETRPALSVGVQDFLGTGILGSEYIVATKTFGPRVLVSGGLGWGRLGSGNSLGALFGARGDVDNPLGGTLTEEQWFRGDVAPFGSVQVRATDNLTLIAEYSSDAYAREAERGLFDPPSPVNVGLRYTFDAGISLGAYWLYGDTLGLTLSFGLNPKAGAAPTGLEPAPIPVQVRPPQDADPEAWETDWVARPAEIAGGRAALAEALAEEGIDLDAASFTATTASVTIRNGRYGAHPQAIGRTARIMSRLLPASVETFEITLSLPVGVPSTTTIIRRSDLEALEFAGTDALAPRLVFADAADGVSTDIVPDGQRFSWGLSPVVRFSLFDPDAPVRGSLDLRLRGRYELARGVVAEGSVSATIVGDFDKIDDDLGDSPLPRVRSDIGLYRGEPRLNSLVLHRYGRPRENVYSRLTAGYLETMYGGLSGELLWMPPDSRLALGVEANYVQKRDYDQGFGFRDFDAFTGHLSAYYDFGNGYLGQIDAGQYLAGDLGATVSVSREFSNGWVVGAFATRTDVSFDDFGEGSYDKGLLITIPIDWALGTPTRRRTSIDLRSVSRDGGARLRVPGRLYDQVRETRGPELTDRLGRFWR